MTGVQTCALRSGDVIRLSAGEQIPSDTQVLEGFTEVNEAMLTGESDLVQKEMDALLLRFSTIVNRIYHILK